MNRILVAGIVLAVIATSIVFVETDVSSTSGPSTFGSSTSTSSIISSQTPLPVDSSTHRPQGCDTKIQTSFGQGYSLAIYSNSTNLQLGQRLCIVAYLQYVNGTVPITQATAYEVNLNYTVSDSAGRVVVQVLCQDEPQPVPQPGVNLSTPVTVTTCVGIWNTQLGYSSNHAVTPEAGPYHVVAEASFPTIDEATGQNSTGYTSTAASVQVSSTASAGG